MVQLLVELRNELQVGLELEMLMIRVVLGLSNMLDEDFIPVI